MDQTLRTRETKADEESSIAGLLGSIAEDAQKLVRQEIALARAELREEWTKTKSAAQQISIAFAMSLATAFLAAVALAEVLSALGMAHWLSYVVVTLIYAVASAILIARGKAEARKIGIVPRQTVETVKENVQWIRKQT
jgi:hypothetical protein